MLGLVVASFAAEHSSFDGVIQFDAQQTTPVPGSLSGAVLNTCLVNCASTTVQSQLSSLIYQGLGVSSTAGTVVLTFACSGSCSAGRALLQIGTGSNAAITISGATAAQLQLLQNNIVSGNLLPFVPVTATVTGSPAAGTLVPFSPSNPVSLCASVQSNTARLCCLSSTNNGVTPQTTCSNTLTGILANANTAGNTLINQGSLACCPCTNGNNAGFQVVALTTAVPLNTICQFRPNGVCGCGRRSKKGLLGLLGLLGLIPLCLCLLICCLCCLRRKRRGQAMLFSQTAVPAPIPAPLPMPLPHLHAEPHLHAGPDFHVHP